MKIVLVEDDFTTQFIFQTSFESMGMEIKTFETTQEFSESVNGQLSNISDTIFLLDVNLPDENSDDFFLRNEKELLQTQNCSFVFLTDLPSSLSINAENYSNVHYSGKSKAIEFVQKNLLD